LSSEGVEIQEGGQKSRFIRTQEGPSPLEMHMEMETIKMVVRQFNICLSYIK
jgi:hypothetical protein